MGQRTDRTSRVIQIVMALASSREGLRSATLEKRFSAGRSTINRDLRFIRDELGLPVENVGSRGSPRHRIVPASLGVMPIDAAASAAFSVARACLAGLRGTSVEAAISELAESMPGKSAALGSLPFVDVHRVEAGTDPEIVAGIESALRLRHRIRLSYRKANQDVLSTQEVDPLRIRVSGNDVYLLAYIPRPQSHANL